MNPPKMVKFKDFLRPLSVFQGKFNFQALFKKVNGKIQGLFKAFDCFSSTFQGKYNFQGLFKTVLYIEVLFKPVRTV